VCLSRENGRYTVVILAVRNAQDRDLIRDLDLARKNEMIAIWQYHFKVVIDVIRASSGIVGGCRRTGLAPSSGSGCVSLGVAYFAVVSGGIDVPRHSSVFCKPLAPLVTILAAEKYEEPSRFLRHWMGRNADDNRVFVY
jgi:hypothetical protein